MLKEVMSREMDNGNVGSRLQSARKARNWTIEEAAKRTKIKKDALQKLETNSFDDLPSVHKNSLSLCSLPKRDHPETHYFTHVSVHMA